MAETTKVSESLGVDRSMQHFWVLLILLVFYCIGPFLVVFLALQSIDASPANKIENQTLLDIMREIATEPGAYTNIIHQLIMPVAAAVTAATATTTPVSRPAHWLFIIPLATIFVCILNALLFNVATDIVEKSVIAQFFINMAGNLSIYLMLLIGLRQANVGKTMS